MTQDAKKESKGFFHIYKPGQGKWVRWGTVIGMAIMSSTGAYWLALKQSQVAQTGPIGQATAAVVWMALWAWLCFWFVNSPKYAEFMIMTESEMCKVSWPSRREVINSTKVVIMLTAALGILLWAVDIGFIKFFQAIGIA